MSRVAGVAASIRHAVRVNRRSLVMSSIAQASEKLLRAYYNEAFYDFARNGECFALAAFAKWSAGRPVVIWDVGANRGEWAAAAHDILPASEITSFEVVPAICDELRRSIGQSAWHTVEASGLSNEEGEVEVHWNHKIDSTSAIDPRLGHEFFDDGAEIVTGRVTTGDLYCAHKGTRSPDLMKIDVEGHEVPVLQGCRAMLAGPDRPAMIQFEYGTTYIPGRNTLMQVFDLLTPAGYRIGRLFPDHVAFSEYRYRDEHFRMGNYIATCERDLEALLA